MSRRLLQSPYTYAALAMGCFITLTALSTTRWAAAVDQALLRALRRNSADLQALGFSWGLEFMRDITSLAGVGLIMLIGAGILTYQALAGAWRAVLLTVTLVGGTQASVSLLKHVISRPRPDLVDYGAQVYTHSFPSGHASMAAALGLTLAWFAAAHHPQRRLKAFFWIAGVAAAALIGFTRIYLGVHWLSDVLAGWSLGTAWACLTIALARHLPSPTPPHIPPRRR